MIKIKLSSDPIKLIQDLNKFNESFDEISKVSDIGQRWKSIKKNIVDYLVNIENSFENLKFDEVSELEFHTMLENILKNTKKSIFQAKTKNQLHKNDFDFILSVLDAVSKSNQNKLKD